MRCFARLTWLTLVVLGTAVPEASLLAAQPVIVSPGSSSGSAVVVGRCPTFTWVVMDDSRGLELAVYELGEAGMEASGSVAISAHLPGGATAWTPTEADCLSYGGRYGWVLGSTNSGGEVAWSAPLFFEVAGVPSLQEIERALEVLEAARKLESRSPSAAWAVRAEMEDVDRGETALQSSPKIGSAIEGAAVEQAALVYVGPKIQFEDDWDVTPEWGGTLVIGSTGARNLAFDGNEIMARYARSPSALYLNADGGSIRTGGPVLAGDDIDLQGNKLWNVGTAYLGLERRTGTSCGDYGVTVLCPYPKKALGGGCTAPSFDNPISRSYPRRDDGWTCTAVDDTCDLTAWVICANVE